MLAISSGINSKPIVSDSPKAKTTLSAPAADSPTPTNPRCTWLSCLKLVVSLERPQDK